VHSLIDGSEIEHGSGDEGLLDDRMEHGKVDFSCGEGMLGM